MLRESPLPPFRITDTNFSSLIYKILSPSPEPVVRVRKPVCTCKCTVIGARAGIQIGMNRGFYTVYAGRIRGRIERERKPVERLNNRR